MKQHPFEPFPGTDAEMFIQWKGTSVCLDFYCPCGAHGHYDGDFAYNLRCPACGAVFELGTQAYHHPDSHAAGTACLAT